MLKNCSWDHGPAKALLFNTLFEWKIKHLFDVIGDNGIWHHTHLGFVLDVVKLLLVLKSLVWLVGKLCSSSAKSIEWKTFYIPTMF